MTDRYTSGAKLIGLVLAASVVVVAALVGPRLYRAARSMIAPVVEMSRLEDRLTALDETVTAHAVSTDTLDPGRLEAFLDIRAELLPLYQRWDAVVREVEAQGESWTGAREVLAASRDVLRGQIEALESRSMSPTEFRAIERVVYDQWLRQIDESSDGTHGETLVEVTRSDLQFLRERSGHEAPSAVLNAFDERLASRLDRLESSGPPVIENVSPEVARLLWTHHERIASLRLGADPMHSVLGSSESGTLDIRIGDADRSADAPRDPDDAPRDR